MVKQLMNHTDQNGFLPVSN